MLIGTPYFITQTHAEKYYVDQGIDSEGVQEKLNNKEIFVGVPPCREGETIELHPKEGRYFILTGCTKNKTVHFYSDPGHGWLKVKRSEIAKLGISNKISSYSYEKGEWVYLEEDCDALLYVKAMEAKGYTISYVDHTANRESRIRNYEAFTI